MESRKGLVLALLFALILFGAGFYFQESGRASEWLWSISDSGTRLLPLIAVSALVDSINPCAFSVLLVSILFLFGLGHTRGRIFTYGFSYILGIFAAYFLIGLGLLQVLHIFSVPHFMSKLAAVLLILWGSLNVLEAVFPNFPIRLAIPHAAHGAMSTLARRASIPAMFLLGGLVGLCEFPCTGGPYLAVVGLLHDMKTYWQGAFYLILYNLIFVAPLVAILFLSSNQVLVERVKKLQSTNKASMKLVAGFLMVILAFVILNL